MQKNDSLLNHILIQQNIDDYAHIEDKTLTSLVIKDGITEIGERAFFKCKNLSKIVFPESLTTIKASAFSGCENLEEIILPSHIKVLQYRAFADCKRLKRIFIPNSVETIEWAVFAGDENLEIIVLPESVKSIGQQLFLNCKKLKQVSIPKHITELPDELLKGCSNLQTISCGQITKIGNRTFENCYKLASFPKQISSFGENCFKNCRSLTSINLPADTKVLPNGMFDGCVNLTSIHYSGNQLSIGEKCFRNCRSMTEIPKFVNHLNRRAFENCTGLTNIAIKVNHIPFGCFRGCKNIKTIEYKVPIMGIAPFAFSGCENLEEMNLSQCFISSLPAETFSGCKRLKKVIFNNGIHKIGSRAFFNCSSLSDINLPDTIDTVKKEAFCGCASIKEITIPANLNFFEDGAFSYMDSLETINVSPFNKTFMTPDHKILINQMQTKLVLYASGLKNKSYSLKDYNLTHTENGDELIRPLYYIGEYAFAGSKNLEELTICGDVRDIEATAFLDCNNLKRLNVDAISFSSCPSFHIKDHGKFYFKEYAKVKAYLPFETVAFSGDLVQIFPNALDNFTNVKTLLLPNEHPYSIDANAFQDCVLLKEVFIPEQVTDIASNAFPTHTKLSFPNQFIVTNLEKFKQGEEYIGKHKLYTLTTGTYYIEQDGKIISITKDYIEKICSHANEVINKPILFFNFMNELLKHDLGIPMLFNGILMTTISPKNKEILFASLKKEDTFFRNVIQNSHLLEAKDQSTIDLLQEKDFSTFVQYVELFRTHHIDNPIMHNKLLIANYQPENFKHLCELDLSLTMTVLLNSHLLDEPLDKALQNKELIQQIFHKNTLETFIQYVKKYEIKDRFLFHKMFIAIANNALTESFFQVFDANMKRLIKASQIMDNSATAFQNLNDLFILLKITGALEDDPIIRQKASTFITEKIFAETFSDDHINEYRIVGDDIHRVFNFSSVRKEFDSEFALFFLENYQELIKIERQRSGFIERVYTNFREISRTCTSDKGSQRKLKVTLNKCKNYLSNIKFDGVTKETEELAILIGTWFDKNEVWINAQQVYAESLKAPRNIFTKVEKDDNNQPIYDYNPEHDLKELISPNYSFEWLPKQDYDNLILGKYCSCCAHIDGAGQGIMRASMILDNCQNLIIRNSLGEIIAKATLYVNKKQGYAVFNNVETSLNHRTPDEKIKIYKAFLRGSKAFLKTYNKNHPGAPILNIYIGANRNTILEYFTDEKHPTTPIHQALQYGSYSLNGFYRYNGDWSNKQRLVLKK